MSNNYKELYKKTVDLGQQQKQRQLAALDEQKHRRQQQQDQHRHVADSNEDEEESNDEAEQQKQNKSQRKQRKKRGGNNVNKSQHYRLQQSEWLRYVPENLCDWLLVPCPVGKRCLVIATHGRTKVYNQAGRIIMQLRTLLPGDGHMPKSKSILDCVYVAETETFYVLDAISFGQQQLLDCEASFRLFWLRSRFDEQDELSQCSKRNEKRFKLLEYYDFENSTAVGEVLQRYPLWEANQPELDGMLFYHKEASYTCGTTPLVCWLFAYMLPDVLNLPVHSAYVAPDDYRGDALTYMDEFDKKLQARRQQHKKPEKPVEQAPKTGEATVNMEQEQEEGEMAEFDELRRLLEHERRLEMGELDMDCTPPETEPGSAVVGNSC